MKLKDAALLDWSWKTWASEICYQIEIEILPFREPCRKLWSQILISAGNSFGRSHNYSLREAWVNILFKWKIEKFLQTLWWERVGFLPVPSPFAIIASSPFSSFVYVCVCVRAYVCARRGVGWGGEKNGGPFSVLSKHSLLSRHHWPAGWTAWKLLLHPMRLHNERICCALNCNLSAVELCTHTAGSGSARQGTTTKVLLVCPYMDN